jgi:thiosulfate/3-mercaptopyruvate sulfurtransferase
LEHLIAPAALAADKTHIVFDCRFSLLDKPAGRRSWEAGHIPGARFADLEQDLSSPAGKGGRHPLPDRDALVARFRAWGVDNDSRLVCYDQTSGALAGRFWWLARWLGHESVRVLDGGLDGWIAAGLPTDREPVNPAPGNFRPRPPLTRVVAVADVVGADAPGAKLKLLDAREAARFRGEQEAIDPVAGHIPGAISAPFSDNLAAGRFKSPEQLRARFAALGVDPRQEIVSYCGSGVTATHNILALKIAGFPEPALYPGSWSEWITDPARPVAKS